MWSSGRETTLNDIAVLRLNGRIAFSENVSPVNLPPAGFDEVEADEEGIERL